MAATARSYDHPRWRYDEASSPAARRSAARAQARSRPAGTAAHGPATATKASPRTAPRAVAAPSLEVVARDRLHVLPLLLVVSFLGLALAAPVILNTAVVRTQWQIAQLRQQQDDLVAERSTLRAEHAALSATQRVKETADRLGMVAPPAVGYIDLGGGSAQPAQAAGPSLAGGVDGAPVIVASAAGEYRVDR